MKLASSLLALAFLSSASLASTHPPISFDEVVKRADVGFHGVVSATREIAPEGVKMAFTVVTFEVRGVAFDRTGTVGNTIELTFAGGRRGDRFVTVAGVPRFEVGDEVVLFARHDGARYADPIIGGPQGRFLVERDEVTGRAFVLTAGRRAMTIGDDGAIATTARVARIENERPVYAESVRPEAPLPTPVGASDPVRHAEEPQDSRPEKVADLTAVLERTRS